ncbi:MAG TPA: Re/Si-specific NAD(P)(+) transhydrogenase subunit alpha [Calditrichia bacterium]|nr:Re/Si-specific NAD(P)(+) transhydrogenase subunit alpha [Calditrichota bacterium]HQU72173.1 Re/Si-specific NAD(P)(+) transhydrogenase subunit alpha [Calditrichia bacterium]HQV31291.1 Re/Si-specific NAD(P)(+) transhydrogenase subunit alpha [Calditrichia bacterium]
MIAGILKETFPNEQRVAIIPASVPTLKKMGVDVIVESGAGTQAGFLDQAFIDQGAKIAKSRKEVFAESDVLLQVRGLGANPEQGKKDVDLFKTGQVHIGFMEPLTAKAEIETYAAKGVTSMAMELIPRITRAQSMDALSAMANLGGYKAVLLAANYLPKIFPMMMTAAGTIVAAKVFIVGAGVAGLQAIATARRLGAIVQAYDVRPAVKEQVESLGGKFVEMDLKTETAEDKGGYAKAMDEDFYRRQREMMLKVVAESDVVITTAAIPGKKAPILVTKEMVEAMRPGSVVVDMAAERGGNCELTKPDEVVVHQEVKVVGTTNLPGQVAFHASQTYAKVMTNLMALLVKEGKLDLNMEDEIIAESVVTQGGEVVNGRVRETLGFAENA